jgi:hypothetical protein
VIGQYGLYCATSGSKPISPIPTSIPMTGIFDFVILSDISAFYFVWQLLVLFLGLPFRN